MPAVIYRFKDFLKDRYPFPVRKLPVHTHLGCPHRENRTGPGGCVYCYNSGFSELPDHFIDVHRQMREGISRARQKGFSGKFIAYFQTDTNTYASVKILEPWWRSIYQFPDDIIGLAVSTRPDYLPEKTLELLAGIGRDRMVWLELGLQSANDRTLEWINRGHNYRCFAETVMQVKRYENILLAAHIILGLPGEDRADMLHTVTEINRLELDGVKIHHLQVVQKTVLADRYAEGRVKTFTEKEYIRLLIDLLPHLSPDISIHRLAGDTRDDLLIAPRWKLTKTTIIQRVESGLRETGKYQGCLWRKEVLRN